MSHDSKSADIQALNTRIFYDIVLLKRKPETSISANLVSNYDLVLHRIASLALQRFDIGKRPNLCTLTSLQEMLYYVRTVFGYYPTIYGGNIWVIPMNPPPPKG